MFLVTKLPIMCCPRPDLLRNIHADVKEAKSLLEGSLKRFHVRDQHKTSETINHSLSGFVPVDIHPREVFIVR